MPNAVPTVRRPGAAAPTLVLGLCAALLATACSAQPGSTPGASTATQGGAASGTPAPTPEVTADPEAIGHPTGANEIVLRSALSGGFVRMEYLMARLPAFTLYGDGRVLVQAPDDGSGGGRGPGGPLAIAPLLEARLSEAEVQAILAYALTDGGLGIARAEYPSMMADVPVTVFEIHAGGVDKMVRAAGMSEEPMPGPDAAILRAFAVLDARLAAVATSSTYAPSAWIAILTESEPDAMNPSVAWPWPDLAPSDFAAPINADPVPFPHHLLTADQVAASGFEVGPGGLSGFRLLGPDGKTYIVAVRPALPEELPAG